MSKYTILLEDTELTGESEVEQDRLDAQAAAIVEMIGGELFLASDQLSTKKVASVVDVGCGTGVATIQ